MGPIIGGADEHEDEAATGTSPAVSGLAAEHEDEATTATSPAVIAERASVP